MSTTPLQQDLVLHSGTVITMDGAATRHEAMLVRRGVIAALGTSREMLAAAGSDPRSVDLAGRTVLPGFIETHAHPGSVGQQLTNAIDPSSPANGSIKDIQERVREAARGRDAGDWLVGQGYDDTAISDMRHPNRHDLDAVAPDCPVVLHHISGHVAAVNTAALRAMNLTRETVDPPGGYLEREADGTPTGVLFETAAMAVHRQVPAPSPAEQAQATAATGRELLGHGITTVHDLAVGHLGIVDAYQRARALLGFKNRVRLYLTRSGLTEVTRRRPELLNEGTALLRANGIKLWADGSLQAETGYLAEAYHCSPANHGAPLLTTEELRAAVTEADAQGLQVAIHANGDAAIDEVLDAYAALGIRASRLPHRIEHFQTAREDQIDRLAQLGVLPSVFVKHVKYWGDRHRDIFLGDARASRISPIASIDQRQVAFALHSDAPVTGLSALEGVQCAVTRRTMSGRLLGADQGVDAETALRGYTSHAAQFSGEADVIGSLQPGMAADLVVLAADPTRVDPEHIANIAVQATYIDGECVYSQG